MSDALSASSSDAFVVLITGASRGIGAEAARCFLAKRGKRSVRLALVYETNGAAVNDLIQSLDDTYPQAPDQHRGFQCNLSDPNACRSLIDAVVAWAGRLDVLVNNAGVSVDRDDWLAVSYEEWQQAWEKTMAINYLAPCNLSYLAVQHFRARAAADPRSGRVPPNTNEAAAISSASSTGDTATTTSAGGAAGSSSSGQREFGRIVNVSSRGAYCGDPTAPAYAASKAALNVFHGATAKQVAAEGIFIFTVAPGATLTDMWRSVASPETLHAMAQRQPLKRLNETEEVASIIAYLGLEAPPTMIGNIVDANGGVYMRA